MDLDELKKMTVPKLRERAKEITDLQGVGGMKKDDLIQAIAKAEGIALGTQEKDVSIASVKQEIRALKKQKEELLASPEGRSTVKQIRRKIKRLKRQTRKLAREAARQKAAQAAAAAAAPPASGAPPAPGTPPASEAPPASGAPPASEAPPAPETPPAPAS
ncbi:MAG: Rho termination factor N-terminal domain-containing protein [Nitrospiraceae bacterium]